MGCTLKDIARISGLSISTVSRALNDSPLTNEKTKTKIKKIAETMNFEFNINARSLIKSQTNTIGIIFANNYYNFKTKTFYSTLERHLLNQIEKNGFSALVQSASSAYTKTSNIKKLVNGKKVDGILIATRDITDEELDILEESDIPFAFLYYNPKRKKYLKRSFLIDNTKSGALAANYLAKKGFKKILTITKETKIETNYIERTRGFLEKAKSLELDISVSKSGVTFEEGYEFTKNNLKNILKYDAVFCQQDYCALGMIKALSEEGIKIPKDISILGHDNFSNIIDMFSPKLTTICLPFEDICVNAIDFLIAKIKKEKISVKKIINAYIVERES